MGGVPPGGWGPDLPLADCANLRAEVFKRVLTGWYGKMDKNGQNKGGARTGAGRKKKPNIAFGNSKSEAVKVQAPAFFDSEQQLGEPFLAKQILDEIHAWLAGNDVLKWVPAHLLQMYATSMARWMQAEEKVNQTGFLAEHPTTRAPIASPFVSLSLEFSKAAQGCWWQIHQIIRDATGGAKIVAEPTNGLMEILKRKKEA